MMEQVVFATNNPTKAKRFSDGLLKNDIEVLSLRDLNVSIEVDECGLNVVENAMLFIEFCNEVKYNYSIIQIFYFYETR